MKTLVNIITDDNPIPAYLFIKEKYEPGDRVIYISAKDTAADLQWLAAIDGIAPEFVDEILLRDDIDEFKYEKICRAVRSHLKKGETYWVNLAGGTRYMALAVQQVFDSFGAKFFYVNIEDNTIIQSFYDDSIYDNDDFFFPIKYRMNLSEYLTANEIVHDMEKSTHKPLLPFQMAENMFQLFSQNLFDNHDFDIMETLRESYRNCKRGVSLFEIENPSRPNNKPLPDIRQFLTMINLSCPNDKLTHEQLEWITGGWFEEYVYYLVQKTVAPDDIAIGLHVSRKGIKRINELDVSFIKNNRFFVIECKTGVETERHFNEIVYKACALREALLGVSCHSYIASLKHDTSGELKKIAANMDITFWDHEIMTTRLNQALEDLNGMIK